jgi:phospholipid transport system transporter-binding protein
LNQAFAVSGELTFATVPRWRRLGLQYIAANPEPIMTFAAVVRCDSSAVALLLAWLRDAKERGRVVRFAQLPQQVLRVAEVYGVLGLVDGNTVNE